MSHDTTKFALKKSKLLCIKTSVVRTLENATENGRVISAEISAINMPDTKSRPQKRRRRSIIAFEMIQLDRSATEPLHEQLYRQIRDELKSGRFSDGSSRLPSSRALATERGISRSTVRLAFSKLHAEGYLRSSPRSGTFIANVLPEKFLTADHPEASRSIQS